MNNFEANRKIPIGISSCLLGERVRYDGGHRLSILVTTQLSGIFEFHSLCPEVAIGLGVPRQPIQLVCTVQGIRVRRVHDRKLDVTHKLRAYAQQVAGDNPGICGYIFKAHSPSCGSHDVVTWTEQGLKSGADGSGVYAAELMNAYPGLPVTDEDYLQDPRHREHFIAEVTARFHRHHR